MKNELRRRAEEMDGATAVSVDRLIMGSGEENDKQILTEL